MADDFLYEETIELEYSDELLSKVCASWIDNEIIDVETKDLAFNYAFKARIVDTPNVVAGKIVISIRAVRL